MAEKIPVSASTVVVGKLFLSLVQTAGSLPIESMHSHLSTWQDEALTV